MSYSNSIISGVLSYIYYTLSNASSSVSVISLIIAIIAFIIMLMILVVLFVYLFGWLERKIIARIQSRHGPTYVGKFGLLQNFADVTKLLSKENIMPKNADMPLFNIIMPVTYALLLFTLFFIPISGSFVGINATISLLVVFTILSFSPLLLFLVAWTSGNKFASISAQRSVMVMISYEIPMLLVVVASAMLSRGFSLYNIVQTQSNVWFALIMPIGFIIFFIVMLAEMERPPFDVREADNELIAGWLTDISAPYYALALFIDYTRVFVGSLLISLIFLGGWLGPSFLPAIFWIAIKVIIVSIAIILVRATTVRMKINNIIRNGWLYLTPLAIINIIVTFLIFVR